jgi:hypothetical protein
MAASRKKIAEAGAEAKATIKSVVIEQPKTFSVALEIQGTASLIQNNFSQKAVEQMLRKHMGLTVQKDRKKPREVLEAATIRNTDGVVCVPPAGLKKAMLTAAGTVKGSKPWQLRTLLFIEGRSVPITYDKMIPRMDMVRTAGVGKTPDVRFRPEFLGWKARVVIQFSDMLSPQTVVDLLNRAGSVGVGEWRPEKSGTFGTFRVVRHIDNPKEVDEVRAGCEVPLVPLVIPEWALDAEIDPEALAKIMGAQPSGVTEADLEDGDEETGSNGAGQTAVATS